MARMHPKRSQRDAMDRESPEPPCRNVCTGTLSKNRIQVQRKLKAKLRLRRNRGKCSSCRSADSCASLNKCYSSEYVSLLFGDKHARFTMSILFRIAFSYV